MLYEKEFIEAIKEKEKITDNFIIDLFFKKSNFGKDKEVIESIAQYRPLLLQQIVIELSIKCEKLEKATNNKKM